MGTKRYVSSGHRIVRARRSERSRRPSGSCRRCLGCSRRSQIETARSRAKAAGLGAQLVRGPVRFRLCSETLRSAASLAKAARERSAGLGVYAWERAFPRTTGGRRKAAHGCQPGSWDREGNDGFRAVGAEAVPPVGCEDARSIAWAAWRWRHLDAAWPGESNADLGASAGSKRRGTSCCKLKRFRAQRVEVVRALGRGLPGRRLVALLARRRVPILRASSKTGLQLR